MNEATHPRSHLLNLAALRRTLTPAALLVVAALFARPLALEAQSRAANGTTDPAWAEPRIRTLFEAFRQRLPGHRALSFYLRQNGATLEVLDAVDPEKVEEYEFDDEAVHGPSRIRWSYASRDQARLGHLIDWDTVSAEVEESLPALLRQALEQTRLEGGGSIEYLHVVWFPNDNAPTIRIHIKGLFQDALVVADTRGKVLSVEITD